MGGYENDPRPTGPEMIIQEEKTSLVQVAIPLPVAGPFTYRLPEHLAPQAQVGSRVRVPFRNRTITGFVIAYEPGEMSVQPKDVLEVLDPKPVVDDHLLRLAKWISDYYFSSLGEAIQNMLPKYLPPSRILRTQEKNELPDTVTNEPPGPIQLNEEQVKAFAELEMFISEKNSEKYFFLE